MSSPVELRALRSYVIQAQARHATRGAREILCEDLLKVTRICKWCEGRQKEEEWIGQGYLPHPTNPALIGQEN